MNKINKLKKQINVLLVESRENVKKVILGNLLKNNTLFPFLFAASNLTLNKTV